MIKAKSVAIRRVRKQKTLRRKDPKCAKVSETKPTLRTTHENGLKTEYYFGDIIKKQEDKRNTNQSYA